VTELVALDDRARAGLLALSTSVGWPHTIEDWRTVLAAGSVVGHREGEVIVSSAAVFPYGEPMVPPIASIGMVLVRPDHRGRGLARALMVRSLADLPASCAVTLVATVEGFPLYRSLHFETVGEVDRFVGREVAGAERVTPFAPVGARDLDAICRLDAEAFGADRRRMLGARLAQASGSALATDGGQPVGFGLAVSQREWLLVGPIVAPDAETAAALVGHLAAGHSGVCRVDVPTSQERLPDLLAARGFARMSRQPTMLLGARALPGHRERLFAIASAGFG